MPSVATIRFAAAFSLAFSGMLSAQLLPQAGQKKPSAAMQSSSALPPTSPTIIAAPPSTPSQLPPHHAEITFTGGNLSISASNSSLNQILREISRETGIKISGGVADERVFGQYGPDTPAQILAVLLDGTGSNMLLVHSDGDTSAELILTPRHGGPSPPNPNAPTFDDGPPTQPSQTTDVQPVRQSLADQVHPAQEPAVAPANVPPASDPNQPQSPNGVKSPQQIYDQLQRLRQQQPTAPQ